jgi:hypothetical protein
MRIMDAKMPKTPATSSPELTPIYSAKFLRGATLSP